MTALAALRVRTSGKLKSNTVERRLCIIFYSMQRKEYANIEIVLTEKKGFGLRAGSDIKKLV